MLPSEEDFPYAMRVVADILESNGSSSMATVCGGSLSMMDAGIPLRAPVAGVAMGLVKEGDDYAILTDIAGAEDHYGDMDFKVTGTTVGVTALQMDIKIQGITPQIMREAMQQAKRGRLFILDKMNAVLSEARTKVSEYAPRFYTLQIPTDKIRDLIGPGGKVIRGIVDATGVKIDVDDSGKVLVSSSDGPAATKALQMIGEITATAEVGKTYLGNVSRLADFGAFVEIFPGTDGLLHISEVAEHRIKDIRDELKEGDQVLVKVLAVEGNRIRLSRKAILKEQRAKMGSAGRRRCRGRRGVRRARSAEAPRSRQPVPAAVTFEGGHEEADEGGDEPNFNRDGAQLTRRSAVHPEAEMLTVIAGVRAVAAVREAAAEAEVAAPANFFEAVLSETAATVRAVAVVLWTRETAKLDKAVRCCYSACCEGRVFPGRPASGSPACQDRANSIHRQQRRRFFLRGRRAADRRR